MVVIKRILDSFNFRKQCEEYNIDIWQCPQFLFLIMGMMNITAIVATNIVARRYMEPEAVALIALGLTAALFVISYIVVASFDRIARTSKAKTEFISIISHRLRSPLSAIKWQLELLLNQHDISALNSESIAEISAQNEKMIRIVNDLLELSQIEDDNLILSPSAFSLKQLVEDVIVLLNKNAEKANISIFLSGEQDMPEVFADRIRTKNIVFHLVDNAIRYSNRSGKVEVNLQKIPSGVKFSVTDEGIGISEDDFKNIFKKFFRSKDILHYQTEGTGIGLFIAKSAIEKSGGKIGFNSIDGKGSTFWFTLPVVGS